MRRLFTASLLILAINICRAQTKLGVQVSPGILGTRIAYDHDVRAVQSGPNSFNLSALLFVESSIGPNYYFSSGIGYTSKKLNLEYKNTRYDRVTSKSYNIQYVRVSVALKLYTNEIALDKRLFFQAGTLLDVAIHEKENMPGFRIIDSFHPMDVSLLLAIGLEVQLAPQTAVQFGCSYTRSLVNMAESYVPTIENLTVKNEIYSVEIAVKF